MKIAVILSAHNRREKTLTCLTALFVCTLPSEAKLTVYITDDGSTDGTSASVNSSFPQVTILKGDGNLFWNGGMRLAFGEALKEGYDYYLWLNDDTVLMPEAISFLLNTEHIVLDDSGKLGIIVGSTRDETTGELTYGGKNRRRWWLPQYLYVDEPGDIPKQCETMNGNCVLIPDEVAKCVGNLDPIFVHSMGDGDYGYRARYAGFKLWIAPGYIGYCSRNTMFHLSKSDQSSVLASLKRVCEPKAVPPNAWYHYTKRHYGFFWPIFCFLPYAMAIFRALRAKFSS